MELLTYWGNYPNLQGYQLFTLDFSETDIEDLLEKQPDLDPRDYRQTRSYGDAWVNEQRSLTLKVPSVVLPMSYNYLINPNHPRFAAATVTAHGAFEYESRLARLVEQAKQAS